MIIVSRHSEEDTSFVSTIKSNCIQNVSVDQQTSSSNQLVRIDGPETITKAEKQKKLYDDKQAPELVDIQFQNKRPFTSSLKGNPCGSTTRASQDDDSYDQENSQSGMFMTNLANVQDDITSTQQDACCALQTSADKSAPEQPINMNSRRQSSRNKLPTARALEALVDGDLTVKRRRK
ncbi:hypothetical protein ACET3Z_032431 [Daucus carota]